MESSVQRRMEAISRHLVLPREPNIVLHQVRLFIHNFLFFLPNDLIDIHTHLLLLVTIFFGGVIVYRFY
jgi:hypothetical protein